MAPSTRENPAPGQPKPIRIIGIGASAGGLAPIEAFLAQLPASAGMAYIVVQHLASTREALLPQLLQRITPMPVHEATHSMRIEANCVYVITPDTQLTVAHGALILGKASATHGARLPIDALFSSLAADQRERAIGVVLSGMGSDGTLGLQAIKAAGGLCAVQEPANAQFGSMPKSAIAAGCADIIAPAEDLPRLILSYGGGSSTVATTVSAENIAESSAEPLRRILATLERKTRHDFSLYKRSTLLRRIERRMSIHHAATQALYADILEVSDQEVHLLFNELLIGVTNFFRDPTVWQFLEDVALPELLERRDPAEDKLRAWVVGCSTGEEAYSLAIVFAEVSRKLPQFRHMSLQIFASDMSPTAIDTARRGRYPKSIEDDISSERLARYFIAHSDYYEINAEIRDRVLFATHDVILDPPFTKLDLLFCRNLLIYFDSTLQRRLLPLFHYSLRPGGLLLLGSAETVGAFTELFAPLQSNLRFYLSLESTSGRRSELLITSFPPLSRMSKELAMPPSDTPKPTSDSLQKAADQVLLQVYAPAAVVINSDGDILHISGRTGKYLEPAAGKANWNFYAMVREGLRTPIAQALKKAPTQAEPTVLHGLSVKLPGGATQNVDVTVQTLREPAQLRGLTIVIFKDIELIAAGRSATKKTSASEAARTLEMQHYNDEIQNLREEARATKEELQSANEELQSTNEELQSTNEELTTSREEMQSMNEELQTINAEMHAKLDDLALAQSDMKNLLNSIEIAIVFLDQNLNVRRYTDRAAKIINIRESDIGRPLSDLTTSLEYPELHDDAQETLRTLAFSEKQVETSDGKWFSVRIMPYRRVDNMIDGVVVTLIDITKTKQLESKLREDSED
jgi:two-component system CheB/CheR fusion protein